MNGEEIDFIEMSKTLYEAQKKKGLEVRDYNKGRTTTGPSPLPGLSAASRVSKSFWRGVIWAIFLELLIVALVVVLVRQC
jgi:hypothetical protein